MKKSEKTIAILILAAGASRRMGSIKQLLPYKKGTLLGHAIEQAKLASPNVYVVLGANSDRIKDSVPNEVTMLQNPDWESGLGSTIAMGIKELSTNHSYQAVLIMLADQPLIEHSFLTKLITAYFEGSHQIVATRYDNKNGVPAIFDKALFSELEALTGDFGAQKLMEKHAKLLTTLDSNDKAIDIDTPEAYKNLLTNTTPK